MLIQEVSVIVILDLTSNQKVHRHYLSNMPTGIEEGSSKGFTQMRWLKPEIDKMISLLAEYIICALVIFFLDYRFSM